MSDEPLDRTWIHELSDSHDLERLDSDTIEQLLDLASRAAHDTGERRNAPLACFLAGLHIGRAGLQASPEAVVDF